MEIFTMVKSKELAIIVIVFLYEFGLGYILTRFYYSNIITMFEYIISMVVSSFLPIGISCLLYSIKYCKP